MLGGIALVVLALLRRRLLMAAILPLILIGANVTTQVLKLALADPRIIELNGTPSVYAGSWPSGHARRRCRLRSASCWSSARACARSRRCWEGVTRLLSATRLSRSLAPAQRRPRRLCRGRDVHADLDRGDRGPRSAAASADGTSGSRDHAAPTDMDDPGLLLLSGLALVLQEPEMAWSALRHPTAIAVGAGIGLLGLALTAGLALVLRR